jgi:hypothetical protein
MQSVIFLVVGVLIGCVARKKVFDETWHAGYIEGVRYGNHENVFLRRRIIHLEAQARQLKRTGVKA